MVVEREKGLGKDREKIAVLIAQQMEKLEIEEGDTLTVFPSRLHGAEIETYNDHRMAMGFAILGLKVPGIRLKNPACVKKTFPSFFQKLAAQPPGGLGARILEGKSGRVLNSAKLLAE
jgi:3-phosphoshikimate 1-carboxyvinyltransferase